MTKKSKSQESNDAAAHVSSLIMANLGKEILREVEQGTFGERMAQKAGLVERTVSFLKSEAAFADNLDSALKDITQSKLKIKNMSPAGQERMAAVMSQKILDSLLEYYQEADNLAKEKSSYAVGYKMPVRIDESNFELSIATSDYGNIAFGDEGSLSQMVKETVAPSQQVSNASVDSRNVEASR